MPRFIDLIGQKFGKLVAIKQVGKDRWGDSLWLCRCDCGDEVIVLGYSLRRGDTKSCGCLRIKHGHAKTGKLTGFYLSWRNMKQRCTNPNNKNYKYYGGMATFVP